jgi:hypothetical protein
MNPSVSSGPPTATANGTRADWGVRGLQIGTTYTFTFASPDLNLNPSTITVMGQKGQKPTIPEIMATKKK